MDQPTPVLAPFQSGWYSFGLGEYRPCNGTYCLYPYKSIPPIPESYFKGKLHWLESLDGDIDRDTQRYRRFSSEDHMQRIDELKEVVTSAQQSGLSLPDTFLQLMTSPELQDRIPSCTDCYFDLSKIVPCPGSEGRYILRFLNDQQGCLTWYLYMTPQGEHSVLVSFAFLDLLADEHCTEEEAIKGTYVCSPSFEEFLYRFWLENNLWYKLIWYKGQKTLTEEEEHYLSHYRIRTDVV